MVKSVARVKPEYTSRQHEYLCQKNPTKSNIKLQNREPVD